MKRIFVNRTRTMAPMKCSRIGKFAILLLTLMAMGFSMVAVPGVEASNLEAGQNKWGHRDAKQPKRKCGDNRITGFSKDLAGGQSGGGSIVHVSGDYRYTKLRTNRGEYTYKMEAKVRVIGGPNDTKGKFVWTNYGNYKCTKQSVTCVNLSVTRGLFLDDRDWPGNVGDSRLSTIRLSHNQVCVDKSTGRIVSGNNPQFMNLNNGAGITFEGWESTPNFNPGRNGTARAYYSILGKYELLLWELLDWLRIPAGLNDLRVVLHATTFVDTTGRRICLELYNSEFTQGVWASGAHRVYFTGQSRDCVPY